ncbi:hypothetical protein BDV18DRAFT_158761 [Aspergillus unguis]
MQARPTSSAAAAQDSTSNSNYKIIPDIANFTKTESTRPAFDHSDTPIEVTKSPYPEWTYGQGVPGYTSSPSLKCKHHEIDPYAPTRTQVSNYRLLISGIAPRPIALVSTVSSLPSQPPRGDETPVTENLAPFSYFQLIEHDPPTFVLGFFSRPGREEDTFRNLKATGECVINTVSEGMLEAVNATALDAPVGVSEWDVSGLTKVESTTVAPARVAESVFCVEGRVVDIKEFASDANGMSASGVVLIRATRFWVQEGAADEDFTHISLDKLRPVAQLGGISVLF